MRRQLTAWNITKLDELKEFIKEAEKLDCTEIDFLEEIVAQEFDPEMSEADNG